MSRGARAGRGNRGIGFDKEVRRVAPLIRRLQATDGITIADVAAALNARGVAPPTGASWTYGTARRVMIRAAELELGVTTRSLKSSRTFFHPAVPKWMGVNFISPADTE